LSVYPFQIVRHVNLHNTQARLVFAHPVQVVFDAIILHAANFDASKARIAQDALKRLSAEIRQMRAQPLETALGGVFAQKALVNIGYLDDDASAGSRHFPNGAQEL